MHFVADPRLVRRVIKKQREGRFGLDVPHGHCCVVDKAPLLACVSESELGTKAADLPDTVVLVARPESADAIMEWRRAFHGRIHHVLEARVREGSLTDARVRERIHRIGQTEFDEIRAVLRAEELLFSPRDDRETYIEFVAFYLELLHFDPEALDEFFPAIGRRHATLFDDIDAKSLVEATKPPSAPALEHHEAPVESVAPSLRPFVPKATSSIDPEAALAKKKGNVVRSMLSRMQGGDAADDDVEELAKRLASALAANGSSGVAYEGAPSLEAWGATIRALAAAAVKQDSLLALPARVLFDMQKACIDAERQRSAVDVFTWLGSFGRRPIVRPLPAVRVVRVTRHLHRAFASSHRAGVRKAARAQLEATFHAALECADANLRAVVKPALESTLTEVGLGPKSVPERVAREKLVEEILDVVRERGTFGLSVLRDALSRSHLKLPNLTPRALVFGDPLLLADSLLGARLDGVYRAGEIYLRGLQKVSSVAFGTRLGRLAMLHVVLPLLVSFVALEGVSHLVHPIAKRLHVHVHLFTPYSFLGVAVFIYGLIHSTQFRAGAKAVAKAFGAVLHAIFIGIPSAIFRWGPVTFLFRSRILSLVTKPLLFCAPAYAVARHFDKEPTHAILIAGGSFVALAIFLGTPLGFRVEEAITDLFLRRLRELSRHVLPGLFALFVDVFRAFVERVERVIYTVDEWLTFKDGQSKLALVFKGALGAVWFVATYLIRIYVNLLIEPQVNPIKHFPVVTVSHKIILPLSPTLLAAFRTPLAPLGVVAANTIAGSTVFLLPGVFGFLVWELKENWKLYDQNRAAALEPVRIGHHGETMQGLLVVGFHSGTVPKLFGKLRHAMKAKDREGKANTARAKIHDVEHAIAMFVDRELVGLLRQAKRWTSGELEVLGIEVASNRIRVTVGCGGCSVEEAAVIFFEEQSGWLVASMPQRGFVDRLADSQRALFELALGGLYQRAGVDVVREQLEGLIGKDTPYDVADEGLVVWPGDGYQTEVVYDLERQGVTEGQVRGAPLASPPPPLDMNKAIFGRQHIAWSTWSTAFDASGDERSLRGPSLLP